VLDVHFADFMRDQVGTVARIYAHFGMPFSDEARGCMERFLAAHPAGEHGAHRYMLAGAGLDVATERRRYAAYQERFGIAAEPVQ
jgi:hypothetical protein